MERCPSGLRSTLGKRVYVKAYRGFESHSLRFFSEKNRRSDPPAWVAGVGFEFLAMFCFAKLTGIAAPAAWAEGPARGDPARGEAHAHGKGGLGGKGRSSFPLALRSSISESKTTGPRREGIPRVAKRTRTEKGA